MTRRRSVAALLGRAFAALIALVIMSGFAGIAASVLQHRSLRDLTDHLVPLRLAAAELRSVLTDAQRSLRGYALTGDRQFLAGYASASAAYPPTVQRMRELATTGSERAAVDAQVRQADGWWRHADRQRGVAPRSEEAAQGVEAGKNLFEPFVASVAAFDRGLAVQEREVRRHSDQLRLATLASLATLTGLAALLAALTAVRTTARITRPLDRLVAVLNALTGGAHAARAHAQADLAEISAVARSVNALADEADRARRRAAETARLTAATRELGNRIREHLSVDAVLEEATAGLGETLGADHVVVRLAGEEGWRRHTVRWSRPGTADARLGTTEPFAGLSADWMIVEGGQRTYVWNELTGAPLPGEERAALTSAGARTVLAVAFPGGPGPAGAVTLIRCTVGADWMPEDCRAAEEVAADLSRGLLQAHLYEREQELVARLRDLDTAKTDFMSTVSHELRTPLTSISGYLEMLTDGDAGPLNEAQERMLGVIERNTTRLRSLIADLLVLSRIESGTLRTSRKPVEFGWLITSAVAAIAPAAAAAGVSVETDVGAALSGQADAEQIDRVLMNLLSNAVKFTPRGGQVRVQAGREGDEVVITVSDTGMGIPEAEQRNLFDRFFRASNATEQAIPGTGLGLAIVRTIVNNHDGGLSLESKEGQGTTVTVRLPS